MYMKTFLSYQYSGQSSEYQYGILHFYRKILRKCSISEISSYVQLLYDSLAGVSGIEGPHHSFPHVRPIIGPGKKAQASGS